MLASEYRFAKVLVISALLSPSKNPMIHSSFIGSCAMSWQAGPVQPHAFSPTASKVSK